MLVQGSTHDTRRDATEDPGTKLGVFSTGPSIPNIPRNIFCEAIATFVLVFAERVNLTV